MGLWNCNLRHLRAVKEIVDLGSINAAADAVNLTQPAITQALAKLERHIGQPLFQRQHNGMLPTEAARLLAPRVGAAIVHIGSNRVTMAQLRALLALGEASSYAGASATTGLAQPTLHRAVSDLALALRCQLVERRGRGIAFSEAGRRVLRGFRLAKAELDAGFSEIDALSGRETGRLAIGAMPLSRARILPAAIAAFHDKHPDIKITVAEGSWQELVEPLRDGELDLMVGALRIPSSEGDICQHALFDDHPVIVGRKGHPLSGTKADAEQLQRYPWIIAAEGTPLRAGWQRMFTEAGLKPPMVPIECGSVMMIRQILIASDFLTLLSPDQIAVELEAGWLEVVGTASSGLVRQIGYTTRADWRPTKSQAAFLTQLEAASGVTAVG